MDVGEVSKKLLEKAGKRKKIETPDQTSKRIDNILERRNKVMSKIEEYQKINGTPSKKEAVDNFLNEETGLGLSEEELDQFTAKE